MIVGNPNFEFLLADDVLLGPIGVVFPEESERERAGENEGNPLCDFARVDDTLQFLDDERTDPH